MLEILHDLLGKKMKKIYQFVEILYDKKIDGTGLGVFRILYGIVLLFEILHFIKYRALIYDPIPYIEQASVSVYVPLLIFSMATILLILGLYTRLATILVYIFSILFFSDIPYFEYHVFYAFMGVNFLIMFLPIHKSLSLDNLRLKLKYSNTRTNFIPNNQVSVLAYYVLFGIGVALVYWSSIFYKFNSVFWLKGLGVWFPASIPQITIFADQWLLNNKYLMLFLGYSVLIFETLLIFLFWNKRLRFIFFIFGVAFHIGIFLEFPIPHFAFAVVALYLLLIPVSYWKKLAVFKFKNPKTTFYYDEECPLCNRTKIVLSHFDVFNAIDFKGVQTYGFSNPKLQNISKNELLDNIYSIDSKGKVRNGISTYSYLFLFIPPLLPLGLLLKLPVISHIGKYLYNYIAKNREVERCTEGNCGYEVPLFPVDIDKVKVLKNITLKKIKLVFVSFALFFILFLQFNADLNSPILSKYANKVFYSGNSIGGNLKNFHIKTRFLSREFFGIIDHGVFYDTHFENYDDIIAIKYKGGEDVWLPIITETGQPGEYLKGTNWVNWTFRVNSANFNEENLIRGIEKYTAFWAYNNDISLEQAEFEILVKKIEMPKKEDWEWEKDYLTNQMKKPWKHYATYVWTNNDGILLK